MPKIKNILIFVAIAVVLFLVYLFFLKPSSSNQAGLISSSDTTPTSNTTSSGTDANTSSIAENFLTLLLNVKTIKLDDSIFTDPAFISLHDSSIVLVPDATTGRPNPFAQFGAENIITPASTTTPSTVPSTTTGASVSKNNTNTKTPAN